MVPLLPISIAIMLAFVCRMSVLISRKLNEAVVLLHAIQLERAL